MAKHDDARIRQRLHELRQELIALGPILRGSVVAIGTKQKKWHFSVNMDGKTHLLYLGQKREARARQYVENYRKLKAIVDEMTLLNVERLRHDATPE